MNTNHSDPTVAGLQPRDEFMRARGISVETFYRWRRRGLPTVNIGRAVYVDPAKARQWFESGMKPATPHEQKPRRRS